MSATRPALPDGVATVREPAVDAGGITLHAAPSWGRFPWLVQGTTGAAASDLGLFGAAAAGAVHARWRALQHALGMPRAVHSRQVHGAAVLEHDDPAPGLLIAAGHDGHVTGTPGVLLTVSVADCVPIFVVDPDRRRVALLHGGWRGTAAGIVEAGVRALASGSRSLRAHLGPAICGACYEVGPEVHEALGLPVPDRSSPVDLRAVHAGRLLQAGVPPEHVTVSEHCTRCGDGFFSHRAGDRERQLGVLGVR